MQERDGRSIPDAALEVLRERAVAMHEAGKAQLAIAAALAEHYPKIAARAKAEGAVIHWGDETGISNQAVHGRSFAPKGQTPVLRRPATRRTLSMISAVTIDRQGRSIRLPKGTPPEAA